MRAFGFSHRCPSLRRSRSSTEDARRDHGRSDRVSALRIRELPRLLEFASRSDLTRFSHISVHAPTDYTSDQEAAVVEQLTCFKERGWPVIAHPDVIRRLHTLEAIGVVSFLGEHGQTQARGADGRGIETCL